ncbi:hypothetical protein PXD56_08150 [Maribacter sp. SA7]|uniref:hypothetical protein n=1 Tax=Maribacter zhoushanensis TaxID=3030012 RepID=UPI0023EB1CEE|nr:hypothetical protein [Maribacter zhoushanensis]MDF4202923.1 hypothetical protein [Maribacter zhoushanensis]
MKIFIFHFLLLFPFIFIAQNKIPFNHTPNGEIVFDTYDSFLNEEYNGLNFYWENEVENYEKGMYYLHNEAEGIPALIWMQNEQKIKVKSFRENSYTKIDMTNLAYYTTKIDSFIVSKNIYLRDQTIKTPTVLQYLGESEEADYAMYYNIKSGAVNKKKILQLKKSEKEKWEELDINTDHPKKILRFFKVYNELNKFYDKQELTINDFLNTLKCEEYYNHYKNNTRIFYDKLWREVKKPDLAAYYGKVTAVDDSIYTVEISNDKKQKLYELNYSSLYPLKRHGKLVVYNEDEIKMERIYEFGDLMSSKKYKDGSLLFHFDYVKFQRAKKSDILKRRAVQIGKEKIKTYNSITVSIENSSNTINYELDKKIVISSHEQSSDGKLYRYSNYENPIEFEIFNNSLRAFLETNKYFNETILSKDYEGSMLLQILTDYKGKVLNYEILNANNSTLEKNILPFYNAYLTDEGKSTIRFKQIKLENKNDRCTFLLPINFEHRQFYKTFSRSNDTNWLWDWQWQQQMYFHNQMMQQQMMNSLPKF